MAKAYPEIGSTDTFTQMTIHHLLQVLPDQTIAYEVLIKKPRSLTDAVDMITWHECCKETTRKKSGLRQLSSYAKEQLTCLPDINDTNESEVRRINGKKFVTEERLIQFGRDLKATIEKLFRNGKVSMDDLDSKDISEEELMPKRQEENIICYFCLQEGHIAPRCPLRHKNRKPATQKDSPKEKQSENVTGPSAGQDLGPVLSKSSLNVDEMAKPLPHVSFKGQELGLAENISAATVENIYIYIPDMLNQNNMKECEDLQIIIERVRAVTIKTPLSEQGLPTKAIVDTGAEVTVLSKQLYDSFPENVKPKLKMAKRGLVVAEAGREMKTCGMTDVEFKIGEYNFTWPVYVAPIRDEILLGCDVIDAMDITVSTKRGIQIKDSWVDCEVI